MHRNVAILVGAIAVIGAVGCKNSTGPGSSVTTHLTCSDSASAADTACALPVQERAKFTVTLVSTSCTAHDNKVSLVSPVSSTLSDDACYETPGKVWTFGPFDVGTQLDFAIQSDLIRTPPTFKVQGAYPDWTLNFEDGGDTDFNDVVLNVKATPAP